MTLVSIVKLKTLDEFSFEIVWSDGIIQYFELSELQLNCPCARCDASYALKQKTTLTLPLQASSIRSIGNYAIQIQFRSGCSSGIYPLSLLRSLGKRLAPSLEDR